MPFISQDFIKDLPHKVDIISTISKRIKLTQKGSNYKACCPFHQEKTPSFNVSATKQAFYCFGCGEKGYVIDFVMKYDNLNFFDAVEKLADENGITIEYDTSGNTAKQSAKQSHNQKLIELSNKVAHFYTQQLKKSPQAIEYAKARGISGEVAKRFALGFAPRNWQNLIKAFPQAEEQKLLTELNLIKHNSEKNSSYDLFVERLMFPIKNHKDQVIAFGGRTLQKEGKPKYLNSPASPIFDKSNTLYGLDVARKYSQNLDYLIVVEGYMDTVSLHQAGITQVVATLGTATTAGHIELLKRNTHKIIFCFDGDSAGQNAALKALRIALPLISANMEINFLFMPEGKDPDDVITEEGVLQFKERIAHATKLSEFLFTSITTADFDTIEGKTAFIDNAVALINTVQYPTYKQQLIEGLGQKLGQNAEKYFSPEEREEVTITPKLPTPTRPDDVIIKNYLAKITGIVLSYPHIADEELQREQFNSIAGSEILQQLLEEISLVPDVNYFELIKPFKNTPKLYNRLFFLAKNQAKLSPDEARSELKNSINALIEHQDKQHTTAKISNIAYSSKEEQDKLIAEIMAKKTKKI